MLRWRLLLGAILIATVAGLCWLDVRTATPGAWLFPLALVIALAASGEMLWLFAARELRPLGWVIYLGNAAVLCANWLPPWHHAGQTIAGLGSSTSALAIFVIVAFAGEMARYTGPGSVTERLGLTVLALAYVGLLLSFVVQLRFLGPNGAWGIPALASLIIVVKMCDIGAYTVGRLFGRHKMTPVLSPGKTIEGAIGGLAFACLGSWLAIKLLLPAVVTNETASPAPAWGWIVYGLAVGAAGIIGDLAESLLKRDLGRKDSSAWLPGFGGVLDIVDSILLAAPVAYFAWVAGMVGP